MHDLTQEEYTKLLLEHNDFENRFTELDRRMKACEDQQETMLSLTRSVDRLTLTVSNMVEEQKSIKAEVKALKEAPIDEMKHYKKTIISCIITTIVGAVIGAIITLVSSGGA